MVNQKSDMKKHSGKSIQAWAADVRTVIIVSTVIFALIQFYVFAGIAGIGAGILLSIFTLGVGCFLA